MQRYLIILFSAVTALVATLHGAQTVSFTTADGIILKGDYQAPAQSRKPVVIMLHGLGSTKGEWGPLEQKLAAAGFGYFAYDARGHGDSTKTTSGTTVSYKYFGAPGPDSQWHAMIGDLDRAVRFLAATKNIKESSLVIAGASVGANIALTWAANHPSVVAIIVLSPGLEYAGIETSGLISQFSHRRIAFAASPNDSYAYQSSHMLLEQIASNPRAVFFEGKAGHGVQMFNGTFEEELVRWLNQ